MARPTRRHKSTASGATIADLLRRAVADHQQGRLAQAEKTYRKVLEEAPQQPDALHLLAVVLHQRGEHGEALNVVRRAIDADGRRAAYHNTRGVILLARGEVEPAITALRRAIALDDGYAEAHNNLANALQRCGQLTEALGHYRRAADVAPNDAKIWCNRGRVLHLLGRAAEAAASLRRALDLRPDYRLASRYLGDSLAELGDADGAEACYQASLAGDTDDFETLAAIAALQERRGDLAAALATAEAVIARDPHNLRARLAAIRALRRQGNLDAALELVVGTDATPLDREQQGMLAFETAAILDKRGNHTGAYPAFTDANRLLSETPEAQAIDRDLFPALIRRLGARFTEDWVRGWSPAPPDAGPPPIFLIGFPRSGTTLLERVLDAHPGLVGLEERPTIDVVRHAVARLPHGYPDALATLSAKTIGDLRALYRAEVARYLAAGERRRVVDKMPLNTIDAGLIHRLFPDARILFAIRHPADVVLSGFMQAFKPNPAMIHFTTLADAAAFYAQVMDLWATYRAVLPLHVFTVRYEDLVVDLERVIRGVIGFLDLPWDDRLLAYRQRTAERTVATPSYHQVSEPLYTRSSGRWLAYADAMAPVLPVLEPFIQRFGYPPLPPAD